MAVTERVIVATADGAGGRGVVASPFQFWVTGEDNIRIAAANVVAGVVVKVQGRFIDRTTNTIRSFAYDFAPTTNRMMTSQPFSLGIGYVLNLTCFVAGATPVVGQVFAKVDIIRGLGGATIALGTLVQGYITANQAIAWPGSPIQQSSDIDGYVKEDSQVIIGGSAFTVPCPPGAHWYLNAVSGTYTASAAVATRTPFLRLQTPTQILYDSPQVQTVIALGSKRYDWALGMTGNVSATVLPVAPIATPTELTNGYSFVINAVNVDLADIWTNVAWQVRERLEVS